jgi:hypothetical protein
LYAVVDISGCIIIFKINELILPTWAGGVTAEKTALFR